MNRSGGTGASHDQGSGTTASSPDVAVSEDQPGTDQRLSTIARLREMIAGVDGNRAAGDRADAERGALALGDQRGQTADDPGLTSERHPGPGDSVSSGPGHSARSGPGHSARSRRIHATRDDGCCDDAQYDGVGRGDEETTLVEITDPERARAIALRHIAARARTVGELRQILDRRQVAPAVAEQVIARFVEVGLIDDADFARQWVATRQKGKSASRARLKRELASKGVDPELITQALDQATVPESQVALDFAQRRARAMTGLDRATITRRLAGQLTRRGFAPSVVRSVVVEVVNEALGGGNIVGDE